MADQLLTLDGNRRRLGRDVLTLADSLGLAPDCAAWVCDSTAGRWSLELATPMIDTQGPDWVYRRLVAMVEHLPLPENISLLEIRLASPSERLWQFVTALLTTDGEGMEFSGNIIQDVELPDMILYRARRSLEPVEQRVAAFDARYRELAA